jgi:hypothetical protein
MCNGTLLHLDKPHIAVATHLHFQSLPDSCGFGVQGNGILQGNLQGLQPRLTDLLN